MDNVASRRLAWKVQPECDRMDIPAHFAAHFIFHFAFSFNLHFVWPHNLRVWLECFMIMCIATFSTPLNSKWQVKYLQNVLHITHSVQIVLHTNYRTCNNYLKWYAFWHNVIPLETVVSFLCLLKHRSIFFP